MPSVRIFKRIEQSRKNLNYFIESSMLAGLQALDFFFSAVTFEYFHWTVEKCKEMSAPTFAIF